MKTEDLTSRRLAVLTSLVSSSPDSKLGRTAVVKLLYFLQELYDVPLGYYFRLYTFGPYDAEILSDVGTAKANEVLTEETILYSVGYGYAIRPGPRAKLAQAVDSDWLQLHRKSIDAVVTEFASLSASELELASTIVYADREMHSQQGQTTVATITKLVHDVKPHFSDETIEKQVESLRDKNHLRSLLPAASGVSS